MYGTLLAYIPVEYNKSTSERGVVLIVEYNFTRPELTKAQIIETTGYDYASLAKQKTYIPSGVHFQISRAMVRGEGVAYAFGKIPQYDFQSILGTWQNTPFNFSIPNLPYANIGFPGFVFEVEANPELMKDGLEILNGKTFRGQYCTNASNC